jgi:hypothetical protein
MLVGPMFLFNESEFWRVCKDLFCFMDFDMVLSSKLLNNLFEPKNLGDLHDSAPYLTAYPSGYVNVTTALVMPFGSAMPRLGEMA